MYPTKRPRVGSTRVCTSSTIAQEPKRERGLECLNTGYEKMRSKPTRIGQTTVTPTGVTVTPTGRRRMMPLCHHNSIKPLLRLPVKREMRRYSSRKTYSRFQVHRAEQTRFNKHTIHLTLPPPPHASARRRTRRRGRTREYTKPICGDTPDRALWPVHLPCAQSTNTRPFASTQPESTHCPSSCAPPDLARARDSLAGKTRTPIYSCARNTAEKQPLPQCKKQYEQKNNPPTPAPPHHPTHEPIPLVIEERNGQSLSRRDARCAHLEMRARSNY